MGRICKLSHLRKYGLQARDGEISRIEQVYFDDRQWTVHYLVVRTGSCLLGREVLMTPRSVRGVDEASRSVDVDLTRQQVKDSPPVRKK